MVASTVTQRPQCHTPSVQRWREQFPITLNLVYFNHAALGPLPVRAYQAMEGHARDQREYGALHWKEWYAEHDRLRRSAAKLLNAQPSEIAVIKNTSEGLSFIAEGLDWQRGDNVVTTDLEFPSNFVPWKRQERHGVEVRVVRSRGGAFDANDVERLIDTRTRVVAISSVAFHNGFAADLPAIGQVCRKHDVLFSVDAIQSLGVLPIDVRESNISFLAADGHKWMCGPEGAGIFFVAAALIDRLRVLENGWTNIDRKGKFIDCASDLLPDARRFEAGSLNTNGIYGLRASIDLLLEVGIDAVAAAAIAATERLADGIEALGWELGTPRPIRSGIVATIPPKDRTLMQWHRRLEEQGIICAPREGMLRFSPHFYNDASDVDRVLEALRAG